MAEPLDGLLKSIHVENRWVDKLFDPYELFPYVDTSPRTLEILTAKSLISKVADVISRKANLASLLGSLSGIDLSQISGSEGGLVGECYRIFEAHLAAKKTLIDRVHAERRGLEKQRLSFAGVQFSHFPTSAEFTKNDFGSAYLDPFWNSRVRADRHFISISGHLCSVAATKAAGNNALPKTLAGSDIRWFLADFPAFALGHPDFQEGVLLIEFSKGALDPLEKGAPLSFDVGWYPYVRVYGHVRSSNSPTISYPVLQFSWMEYRKPKNPAQSQNLIMSAYEDRTSMVDEGFSVNKKLQLDVLLFLQVLRLMQKSLLRGLKELPSNILPLAKDAYDRLSPELQSLVPESDRL